MEVDTTTRAFSYLLRGSIYLKLKNYSAAAQDIDRAIELDPGNFEGYGYRSNLRILKGDSTGAEADLKKFKELGGEY